MKHLMIFLNNKKKTNLFVRIQYSISQNWKENINLNIQHQASYWQQNSKKTTNKNTWTINTNINGKRTKN